MGLLKSKTVQRTILDTVQTGDYWRIIEIAEFKGEDPFVKVNVSLYTSQSARENGDHPIDTQSILFNGFSFDLEALNEEGENHYSMLYEKIKSDVNFFVDAQDA